MFRRPTEEEKNLYKRAIGRKAPWCILWEAPKLFWDRWQGITLGPLIVQRDLNRTDVVVHEMVHVSQYYRSLIIGFLVKYFYELSTKGYRNISYEVEAYEVQRKVREWLN